MTDARISELVEKSSRARENCDALIAVCQDIASEIESGRCNIHTVVEALGPHLTNTDVSIRGHGVKTLSTVIGNLSKEFLNDKEVELLTAFYFDRLKDHHTIGPSTVLGILAIVQMKNLQTNAPSRLFHGLCQHIRCQSELMETRRNIYTIFQVLLLKHLDDLRSLGPDFVYGIISAMDGECEPRNLMLLFNFLPNFIKQFPLGHLTEEMFEVVACYFPIDFNSSITGDKKKITRDDLAEALAPCLYAIPEFAAYCLPHLMEKLDSDRKIAKLDSLNVLRKGAPIFRSKGFKNHLDELWPLLRKEVMSGSDQEIKSCALGALTEVVKAIADDEEVRKSFVEKIFTDTRWSFCDVQLSLYWPAEKLLQAVARTEKNSCAQVLLEVIPLCLGQYSTKTSPADKVTLMETLNDFVGICGDFGFTIGDVPELAWTDIPGLYLNELDTSDNTLKAKTLGGLIVQKNSLKEGQRATVYGKVCDLIESDITCEVRNIAHKTLVEFAKLYPKEILAVFAKRLQINVDNIDTELLTRRLEAISLLAKIADIGVVVLPQILEIATSARPEVDSTALSCLRRLLASSNSEFDTPNYMYKNCNAIDRLKSTATRNSTNLPLVSSVCGSIVRKLSVEDQQSIVDKYAKIRDERLSELDVFLLEGILTPMRQNVRIRDVENLIWELFDLAVDSSRPEASNSSCKLIAVLVNKTTENVECGRLLNHLRERVTDILESDDPTIGTKKATIHLHAWLTKALITNGSSYSQDFLDYQINILRLDEIGAHVPEEFRTLVDKSENTLTEENFCTIRIFYKQRIFQNVIQLNKDFDAQSRQNYLVALAHLVEEVPIELPFLHLGGLVPLLIESLSLDDGQLLLSTLKTLKLLLETKHEIFLDQIQCFVSRCLELATYKKMNVRIAAVDCLVSYTIYPTIELLKYKQDVLDKLLEPLDDHKRLVRKITAKARTRWFLVGAPGTPG